MSYSIPEMDQTLFILSTLGVETSDDFKFEEADLLSALRPIQARKLLAAWKLRCKSSFNVQTNEARMCNVNFVVLMLCVFTGETPETSSSSAVASSGPPLSSESISPRSSSGKGLKRGRLSTKVKKRVKKG